MNSLVVLHPSHCDSYLMSWWFLLRHWGAFSQSLGGPKAPKPELLINGKASFSGMYPRSITDLCCCQLAAAVAHLLPVLSWGHDTKIGSPASKSVAPILGHGTCVFLPSAKSALSCDRLHISFMFSFAVYLYPTKSPLRFFAKQYGVQGVSRTSTSFPHIPVSFWGKKM